MTPTTPTSPRPTWQAHNVLDTVPLAPETRRPNARVSAIRELGHALSEAEHDAPRIFAALATALTSSLCDACSIVLLPRTALAVPVPRHRDDPRDDVLAKLSASAEPGVLEFASEDQARAVLPAYGSYIDSFGLSGLVTIQITGRSLVRGVVVATRDGGSLPFDREELTAIETCIEYATLAAENALQLDLERARTSTFHREMVGIMGHDIRGPLDAILLATEMLAMETPEDPSGVSVVRRVGTFAQRLTRMVDQLLDITRARLGGGIPLARTKTRMVSLIRSMVGELARTSPVPRFELEVDVEVEGIWDPDRIAQVVSNLLSNAIQHSPEDAAIRICVFGEPGTARITVTNQLRDVPLSPATLAKLFEPYRRDLDYVRVGTGLGLGLYIVQEIVGAHGGSVAVESSLAGTTFQVILPTRA